MRLVIADEYGKQIATVVSRVSQLKTGVLVHTVVTTDGKTLYEEIFTSGTVPLETGFASALTSAKNIYGKSNLQLVFSM